jgi:hypothetical protein
MNPSVVESGQDRLAGQEFLGSVEFFGERSFAHSDDGGGVLQHGLGARL